MELPSAMRYVLRGSSSRYSGRGIPGRPRESGENKVPMWGRSGSHRLSHSLHFRRTARRDGPYLFRILIHFPRRQGWTSGPSARKWRECNADEGSFRLSSAFPFTPLSQDRSERRSLPFPHSHSLPPKAGMDLRAVRAKVERMQRRCGVVPALIGFRIRYTFAGPLGETVPTFSHSHSPRLRPKVWMNQLSC